ncbi:exonuclease sbcCD subunit D, partial [Streptococcus thermophilus]
DASGDMSQTFHTLEVKRPIVALQESFETLISPEFYKNQPCQKAWFAFDVQLSSRKELEGINVRARLEE